MFRLMLFDLSFYKKITGPIMGIFAILGKPY